jgi:hypothetical protein
MQHLEDIAESTQVHGMPVPMVMGNSQTYRLDSPLAE